MKRFSSLLVFLAALLFWQSSAFAQQDANLTLFRHNQFYFNPAAAGTEGMAKVSFLHRSQWVGWSDHRTGDGAPTTQILTFHSPENLYGNAGAGASVTNDQLGPLNNVMATVSGSYRFQVKEGFLSFGLRGGFFAQSISDDYVPFDENDPLLEQFGSRPTQFKPDFSFGAYYYHEDYFGGVSVAHILRPNFDFDDNQLRNPLERHIYITGGYRYQVNPYFYLEPTLFVRSDGNRTSFDFGGMMDYQYGRRRHHFYGGVTFRDSESLNLILGSSMLDENQLRLFYSADFVVANSAAKGSTSHEIMLTYLFDVRLKGSEPNIRTPRYFKENQ